MFDQNNDIKNEINIDLKEVPIRALSLSTRHQLSLYLNGEQVITTTDGLCRDYRGLAQLMGFSYSVVNSISQSNDPFNSLIEKFQNRSNTSFEQFFKMIEQIGRFDIIDDMEHIILSDAKQYLKNKIDKNYKTLGKIFLLNITQKMNLLFKLLIVFIN